MWKHHVVYDSQPRSVIVTLGGHLYRIPEVVLTTVPPKSVARLLSHTAKFSFFTICSKGEKKDTAPTTASAQAPSIQQKHIVEEKADILLYLQLCLHNASLSLETIGWWNRFNPIDGRY